MKIIILIMKIIILIILIIIFNISDPISYSF